MKEREQYIEFVTKTFDALKEQFLRKNDQYAKLDPLKNFKAGARLRYNGKDDLENCYEMALDYETKHITHVFNNSINGDKVDESLKDIAIYSVIELYMVDKWKRENL